jgi:3'-5' exoribonuclease
MPQNKLLKDLHPGDELNEYLLLAKLEKKKTRTNNDYLDLMLQDSTMSISAKLWDNFSDFLTNAEEGGIVKVEGIIEEFNNQNQVKVKNIRVAGPGDNVSLDQFLQRSKRNLDEMKSELNDRIDKIQNTYLNRLIKQLLSGVKLEMYYRVPAGKSWHHSYLHGLLEHTLEIIKICDLMADFHPEVNRDLLITGAILHDFGKTEELSSDASFEYTDRGRLVGHIVIAASEVEKAADSIPGFPAKLKDQVIHLILSHQGKLEYASPVEPKTLEAIILYQSDELSAKANAYKNAIEQESSSKSNWTRFLPLANTSLYINREEEENPKETLF